MYQIGYDILVLSSLSAICSWCQLLPRENVHEDILTFMLISNGQHIMLDLVILNLVLKILAYQSHIN